MTANFQTIRQYHADYDLLFTKCQEAIRLCGFTIRDLNPSFGHIKAKVGVSWRSFGEDFELQINRDGAINAKSTCSMSTTFLDYGKNRANIEKFFEALGTLLGSGTPVVSAPASTPTQRIQLGQDRQLQERTEVIGVEEMPLDNRLGSQILSVEHEFSKTTHNDISLEAAQNVESLIGADLLKILKAEVSHAFSQKSGQSIGESITRRCHLTFSINPGDFIVYKVIWKRKVLSGEYEVVANQRHLVVPYSARFGLEYEVSASKGN